MTTLVSRKPGPSALPALGPTIPHILRRVWHSLLPLLLPLGVLGVWHLSSAHGWVSTHILPAPDHVYHTFLDLWRDGDIGSALWLSTQRLALGCLLGGALGLALGALLGSHAPSRTHLEPLMRGLFAVPTIGWIPILILVFGVDEALKILIIAKAVMVPITLHTSQALQAVPARYREVADSLALRRSTRLWRLTLPAALPTLASGIRLGLGSAFIALVVVEMLAATDGIGYMMVWGRTLFQMDIVMVGMVLVGLFGYALDTAVRRALRHLQRWNPNHD